MDHRLPELRIYSDEIIVDSFAGGGGASLGIEMALGRSPDIAINHDAEAIAMHARNHPTTKHYCEDVWKVSPREAVAGRKVGLMWLSPDCKHFSKAKGGKPVEKKIRGLAWVAYRWAKEVRPRMIALENVEEFVTWGPLGPDGKPCALRKGFTFRRFVAMLSNLGYTVDWRELVAADYGAPTTRKRLFVIARCDGESIAWPEPTHSKDGRFLPRWRPAADCIDFTLPCPSIFLTKDEARKVGVKRPLAENTMRRIARGLRKFVLDNPRPFIVGEGLAPFVTEHANASSPRSFAADEPLRTQCAQVKGGHFALVAPYAIPRYGEREGQEPRASSLEQPSPTIVPDRNGAQLVAAFMAKHNGGHEATGQILERPLDTITGTDQKALVTSNLVKLKGTAKDGTPTDTPLPTVQAGGNHYAEVRAFLTRYNGTSVGQSPAEPMSTVDATDRLGVVTVWDAAYVIVDIGMRMLQPRELYRAQGFPDTYQIDFHFNGKPLPKDAQVRMVGNSVCPPVAAAIIRANFAIAEAERVA
jgi:DNA (cytosine-5)-methyltransferase 1